MVLVSSELREAERKWICDSANLISRRSRLGSRISLGSPRLRNSSPHLLPLLHRHLHHPFNTPPSPPSLPLLLLLFHYLYIQMAPAPPSPPTASSSLILTFPTPAILLITLNRPQQLNSLTNALHHELASLWTWYDATPSLRCAIITGARPPAGSRFIASFCAGQDLKGALLPLLFTAL